MYQNQQKQNNLIEKSILLSKEYLTGCNYPNRNSLPEVKELDNQPKIDWQQILYSLTELSPFPIGIVCLESQQVLFRNELLASFFAIEPSQRFDKIIPSFYDQPTLWAKLVNNLKSGNLIKNCAVEVKKANGDTFKAEISAKVVNYEDKLAALFIFMNSTEHLKTQQEDFSLTTTVEEITDPIDFTYSQSNLVDANPSIVSTTGNQNAQSVEKISPLQEPEVDLHLMERAINASSNGIILTDPNQPDNPIIYVNPAFESITGYCASEVIGRNCRFLQGNDSEQLALQELRNAIQERRECHVILRNYRKDNVPFWHELYLAPVFDNSGYLTNFIGIQTDITERKLLEEKLVHNAFYDALTGLPNRILFINRLEQAIAQIKHNPDDLFAVLFLDLDRFKVVNDSLGHLVGDQLLVTLAQRLQQCLQPDDIVARLGGDEFTILLSHIQTIEDATDIAEHIHQALKSPFNLCGYEVFMTASIGIALGTNQYVQPADLLRDADTALYRAKEQSQVGHIVFDSTMYDRAVALLQLETDLRWAIERQELCIFYQPIICIKTGTITGFEALVRWQHPERGLISPAEFIPVAEETGLIIPIGQWVLTESCKQLRQWQLQFPAIKPLTLNVNLSGKQFSQPHLIKQISQILQDTSLGPSNLKLEITETAIIASPEKATSVLKQLKAFGLQLCIDDFGTGYSSLAYLHNFPIDVLKIDRSFINRIDSDTEQFAIVRAIVTLADNLGMSVVAEGVETIDQLKQLKLLQCQQAQGYLFSKPLDREQARTLLASGQSFLRA